VHAVSSISGADNGALCRELASEDMSGWLRASAMAFRFAHMVAPELVFHQIGVDDEPTAVQREL